MVSWEVGTKFGLLDADVSCANDDSSPCVVVPFEARLPGEGNGKRRGLWGRDEKISINSAKLRYLLMLEFNKKPD